MDSQELHLWNMRHPIGTPVLALHPAGLNDPRPNPLRTKTIGAAFFPQDGGEAVVQVAGFVDCWIPLSDISAMPAAAPIKQKRIHLEVSFSKPQAAYFRVFVANWNSDGEGNALKPTVEILYEEENETSVLLSLWFKSRRWGYWFGAKWAVALVQTIDPMIAQGVFALEERRCRVCGCTEDDCRQCIEKTGEPCHWVADDLCSACMEVGEEVHDV